jgi:ribonuclease III
MTLPKIPHPKHGASPPLTGARAALSGQITGWLAPRVGHRFADPGLLQLAMTHRSYANEHPEEVRAHNERLEFLGDAVLDLVVSDLLYTRYPDLTEGELSKLRASLVSEASLADLARELDLGSALRVGRGEASSGGRTKASLLSDALEAVIAAIYLDSGSKRGIDSVRNLIVSWIGPRIEHALETAAVLDFKTELQEWAQKRYKEPVHYRIISEDGPDHDKTFEAAVLLQERELARGRGKSKKQAEQAAARTALLAIQAANSDVPEGAGHE